MTRLWRLWTCATFQPWVCRMTRRHSVVARIPLCFRCLREWDSWEDVHA